MSEQLEAAYRVSESTKEFLLLISLLLDDSGSIKDYGNEAAVRRGVNHDLNLWKSPEAGHILVGAHTLNSGELFSYCDPHQAPEITVRNYQGNGGTPFFREGKALLNRVKQTRDELSHHFDVYCMSFLFSDGENTTANNHTADQFREEAEPMIASDRHIIGAFGVQGAVDFDRIYRSMGIPQQWIKILGRDSASIETGLREAGSTGTVSSLGPDHFTRTSTTGFGDTRMD
jgi:hypothetical protein